MRLWFKRFWSDPVIDHDRRDYNCRWWIGDNATTDGRPLKLDAVCKVCRSHRAI